MEVNMIFNMKHTIKIIGLCVNIPYVQAAALKSVVNIRRNIECLYSTLLLLNSET